MSTNNLTTRERTCTFYAPDSCSFLGTGLKAVTSAKALPVWVVMAMLGLLPATAAVGWWLFEDSSSAENVGLLFQPAPHIS